MATDVGPQVGAVVIGEGRRGREAQKAQNYIGRYHGGFLSM